MVLNTRKKSHRGGLGNIYSSLVTGLSPLLSEIKPTSTSTIKKLSKVRRKKVIKKKKKKFSIFNFIKKKHKHKSGKVKKFKARKKPKKFKKKKSIALKRKSNSINNFGKNKRKKFATKDLFSEG